ncbi:hypothetical protein LTR41_011845 [Exophiala xenobiotica]|nr:hypothetical protein LTR41_011845 [Exophiala xenobiotica]KAK5550330.1 hypothetical protein LTR46_011668 [Exophiala xenobiotica]
MTICDPPQGYPKEIIGYAEPWVVNPGDTVDIKISSTEDKYEYSTFRIIQGCTYPDGPPVKSERVSSVPSGTGRGRFQLAHPGSYAYVPESPIIAPSGFEFVLWFQPWLVGWRSAGHVQTILSTLDVASYTGFAAVINTAEEVEFWIGKGDDVEVVNSQFKPTHKEWVKLTISSLDGAFEADLEQLDNYAGPQGPMAAHVKHQLRAPLAIQGGPLIFAAGLAEQHNKGTEKPSAFFNGRISAPKISTIARPSSVLANWDFGVEPGGDLIHDVSGNGFHGKLFNAPTRAVKGHDWDYTGVDWTRARSGYGGLHFHEDDLDDAQWETDFTIKVPDNARSGVYNVEVTSGAVGDKIPFFVRPTATTTAKLGAKVAMVLPTYCYLAYGNEQLWNQARSSSFPVPYPDFEGEAFSKMKRRLDLGGSTYDTHNDNHGTRYSSAKRPILNMRTDYIGWYFNRPQELGADTFMIGLLEDQGIPYDVLTDHDLQVGGAGVLCQYNVVITGSHPEYPTWETFTAYREYTQNGGNLMYLGGNGFYWVTGNDPERHPERIEVRRGDTGVRSYTVENGELHLSTNGQIGGMWRARGVPCNLLTGTGTCSEGPYEGVPYHRTAAAREQQYAWIFQGLDQEELIGEYGLAGPASGNEMDKHDVGNGSPSSSVVLATTMGHSEHFIIDPSDLPYPLTHPVCLVGSETREIRSDMVYLRTTGGGQVFSVGSVNWYCSMAWKGYNNNVATVTLNVLRRFLKKESDEKELEPASRAS